MSQTEPTPAEKTAGELYTDCLAEIAECKKQMTTQEMAAVTSRNAKLWGKHGEKLRGLLDKKMELTRAMQEAAKPKAEEVKPELVDAKLMAMDRDVVRQLSRKLGIIPPAPTLRTVHTSQALWGPDGVVYQVVGSFIDRIAVRAEGSDETHEVFETDLYKFTPALMPTLIVTAPNIVPDAPTPDPAPKRNASTPPAKGKGKAKPVDGASDAGV